MSLREHDTPMTEGEARVRAAIERLDYDFSRFTIQHFVAHVAHLRSRDIISRGIPLARDLHAFWIRAETAEYVFFNSHTHEVHRVHHVLHELGHMLLEHPLYDLAQFLPPELADELRRIIAPRLMGHCRRWNFYDTPEEREAELFVRQLQQEILLTGRFASLTHPDTSIDMLHRFTRSLGFDG